MEPKSKSYVATGKGILDPSSITLLPTTWMSNYPQMGYFRSQLKKHGIQLFTHIKEKFNTVVETNLTKWKTWTVVSYKNQMINNWPILLQLKQEAVSYLYQANR